MTEVYEALKLAVDELREKKLMPSENYRLTVSRVAGEWVFWFVFLPETFGSDITVTVADDGQVRSTVGF